MQYNLLGTTGVKVSSLCFGTMTFGGMSDELSPPMQYEDLINSLTPEVYERLKRAVEVGKWPDGRPLTREQRETTMRAMIAWGEKNLPPEQRVGFIDRGSKAEGEVCDDPLEQPLNWQE